MISYKERPPEFVEEGGVRYPVRTDFRVWMRAEEILLEDAPAEERAAELLLLCYKEALPPKLETAIRLLIRFYRGGEEKSERRGGGRRQRICDYGVDFDLIYAAFFEWYGIDLTAEELHWWKFLALFRALPEDCRIVQVMRWRAAELSEIKNKAQKEFYRRMKRLYRLPARKGGEETDYDLAESVAEMIG